MDFWAQFWGIFVGVVAGTVVTILLNECVRWKNQNRLVEALKTELNINISQIDAWLEEFTKYRNAVNGDNSENYFGYFRLSSYLGVAVSQFHQSGLAYTHIPSKFIPKMLEVYNDFSYNAENYLNNEIRKAKEDKSNKKAMLSMIDFWETKLTAHKNTVKEVIEALNNK